jgi:mono/diheme cytochrome c family protein
MTTCWNDLLPMRTSRLPLRCWVALGFLVFATPILAEEPAATTENAPAAEVDYLRDIKPLLAEHCIRCHGVQKQESGLRLDNAKTMRTGGNSGPAITPGDPGKSLLLLAVQGQGDGERMPPEGDPLSPAQIELLTAWVKAGAIAPEETITEVLRSDHWAFKQPELPTIPAVKQAEWVQNPIDNFILERLETEGIAPSAPADRATLMRRVSLDLTGIPPTPEAVASFLADQRPAAYGELVDRLLASPHYGERWGRHWLDVARYADSNGYTRDFGRQIWRYRDWVIDAINRDLPYDQFIIEQLAGDLLPNPTLEQRIATGFHRNTLINEEGGTDAEQFRVEAVADRVATTGSAMLGLTLECARCHEHKFDPIAQREFYEFFAFFNSCDEPTIDAPTPEQVASGAMENRVKFREQIDVFEKQLAEQQEEFLRLQFLWEKAITPEFFRSLPGPTQTALMDPPAIRNKQQKKFVADVFRKSDEAREAFPAIDQIETLKKKMPQIPTTMVLVERAKPRETFIHRRGNFLDPGMKVEPHVPRVLPPLPEGIERPTRLDLAKWLMSAENPLTARVTVNRVWQEYFGRGIVETENDFGLQGSLPTHPKLLDWLALQLIEQKWSMKAFHRLIVHSAVYRQSSNTRPDLAEIDPANHLLARQTRLRLDAEIVRDATLAISGLLSEKIGGPSVTPPQPAGVFQFTQDPKPWKTATGEDRYRRGMYTYFWRSSPYPALMVFDMPNSNVTCTRRPRSNTPLQALTLANDEAFLESARALGARILRESPESDSGRADYAFRLCLSRSPNAAEQRRVLQLIADTRTSYAADPSAATSLLGGAKLEPFSEVQYATWTAVSRVLLNLDEVITRE